MRYLLILVGLLALGGCCSDLPATCGPSGGYLEGDDGAPILYFGPFVGTDATTGDEIRLAAGESCVP